MVQARERIEALYKKFGTTTFQRVYRRLGDREAALDITQEVFKNLMSVASRLEDSERTHRYLYRATTNAIHRYLGQQQRQRHLHEAFETTESQKQAAIPKESAIAQRLALLDLEAIRPSFSTHEWELLYYRFFEELSTAEIGDIFEISDRAVRKRLTKLEAKFKTLQKSLRDELSIDKVWS